MLDMKCIREDAERVIAGLNRRNGDFRPQVEKLLSLDNSRRTLLQEIEAGKAEQNAASKQIPQLKKAGEDTTALMAKMKDISGKVSESNASLRDVEEELNRILLSLPNIPGANIPDGKDSEDNLEVRRWGTPPTFDFTPRPHWEVGETLGILDPTRAAKVTGARFHFYKGAGARLERAIMNFFLDTHGAADYTELLPPYMVNRASMTGTGQLPKFEEDAFAVKDTDYFMVPTAEVPVTNFHRDEILTAEELPLSYCAYTPCFRAEAGSAGRDTRGLIRQHQFNKVELVKFSHPEHSYEQLELLTRQAESVLQKLDLPYRVVNLCAGDLGFSSSQTYDIEVWLPSYDRYVEISSCSNFTDYQARRAGIRYRENGGKAALIHTLNGSGVALGRTTAAILENFQNADGSVTVPKVLVPYLGGLEVIS